MHEYGDTNGWIGFCFWRVGDEKNLVVLNHFVCVCVFVVFTALNKLEFSTTNARFHTNKSIQK